MVFIDLLKKLFKKQEKEPEIERINFNHIDQWIEDQKEEEKDKNKEILGIIKLNINKFDKDLNEKTAILDNIDFDKIKFEDRAKNIVRENFEIYIEHLKRLKQDLNELETVNSGKLFDDLDSLFLKFQKRSYMNFEKATVLIGKELGDIQYCINNFKSNVKKTINNNISYFNKTKIIKLINNHLNKKEETNKTKEEVEKNLNNYNKEIEILNNKIHKIENKKEEIKNSKEYIEYDNKIKENENLKVKLESETYNLKKLIDFKQLTNFFHINKRDLEIIKSYNDNFKKSFEANNNQIIQLLNESKLINPSINNKFNEIIELKKNIDNFIPEKDEIKTLDETIKKKNIEIEEINSKKSKEVKRHDKVNRNIAELIKIIKDDFKKINIIIN